ncbi:5'-nucleotidase, lipoprotein e(P4) family [Labrys portucalensis]|uniref:5'-nucleotidase, lipoprotein e(P4) family n=1 Tax=Labrys neptuniae TaxID=376174 RepID=A0ABV3PFQ2_9HYPH|nr:5'-nucleotidase, lipoprotein e(P4) family [Labrys neptuniae]MDT3377514.1 5'-nucleotidase, lipoprotein e(P4) family [Labrys neptuniae]
MRGALIGLYLSSTLVAASGIPAPAQAQDSAKPDDNLNAVLWDQTAVEAKANATAMFALAKIRLDQALADPAWTAAPVEQTGDFKDHPPAIVLDVDDTLLNTSNYQAWNVKAGTRFTPETWTKYVKAQVDTVIPGAVEFTQYAASKGVKVFYVTNRTKEEEEPTVQLMTKLGFPDGGNVDTFLSAKEQPDWKSAKGTRRAVIAKDYRILLLVGDNLGDFTDAYKGTPEERDKVFADNASHWGHDWIVIANPTYGSFESAPYKSNYELSADEQRKLKIEALKSWDGQ